MEQNTNTHIKLEKSNSKLCSKFTVNLTVPERMQTKKKHFSRLVYICQVFSINIFLFFLFTYSTENMHSNSQHVFFFRLEPKAILLEP